MPASNQNIQMEVIAFSQQFNNNFGKLPQFECSNVASIDTLSQQLEKELRNAKRILLQQVGVLLPNGLTKRIAEQILEMADSEPCGLRGCCIYVSFEGLQKVAKIRLDPATPATFELYLTLKQAHGWDDFLPQFLKKMTRGGTIVFSSSFALEKRKLYRFYDD